MRWILGYFEPWDAGSLWDHDWDVVDYPWLSHFSPTRLHLRWLLHPRPRDWVPPKPVHHWDTGSAVESLEELDTDLLEFIETELHSHQEEVDVELERVLHRTGLDVSLSRFPLGLAPLLVKQGLSLMRGLEDLRSGGGPPVGSQDRLILETVARELTTTEPDPTGTIEYLLDTYPGYTR